MVRRGSWVWGLEHDKESKEVRDEGRHIRYEVNQQDRNHRDQFSSVVTAESPRLLTRKPGQDFRMRKAPRRRKPIPEPIDVINLQSEAARLLR